MKASQAPLVDEFCDALWLEDGLARNTLESYRRDLAQFARWLDAEHHRTLIGAEKADVLAYLAVRVRSGVRARTTARLLSSLKRFYRYVVREGRRESDPTVAIDAPKLPRALPKTMTEAQVEDLLAQPAVGTDLGLRDRAMLEVL